MSLWDGHLPDGSWIRMGTFHSRRTYSHILMGVPDQQDIQRVLDHAPTWARRLCGDPILILSPTISMDYSDPRPPSFVCCGKFRGPAKDLLECFSYLNIVWFQDQSPIEGLQLELTDSDWWNSAIDSCDSPHPSVQIEIPFLLSELRVGLRLFEQFVKLAIQHLALIFLRRE